MKWKLPVLLIVFFIAAVSPVFAVDDNGSFLKNYLCQFESMRKLFGLDCDTAATDGPKEQFEDDTKSLKLRFFNPPPSNTPTLTITPTPIDSPTPTPDPGNNSPNSQTPLGTSQTQQVDWTFNGQGVCWSAWAGASCSLTPHEGGGFAGIRDLDGDGTPDVECSTGDGAAHTTTITNTSQKTFTVRCEQYTCSSCQSGNGTHAQCDGGIDPSAQKTVNEYSLSPGASTTCTMSGIGSVPTNPPNTPVPQPTNPPVVPTPTLPSGQQPPIQTSCRIGTGPCSVENLMNYFPDYTAAYKASVICQAESGSSPVAMNKGCLSGTSYDYSVGLFQFNLIAHCPQGITGNGTTCSIVNQTALNSCITNYQNADFNIRAAVSLSQNGTNWYPSWGAAGPAYCNIP